MDTIFFDIHSLPLDIIKYIIHTSIDFNDIYNLRLTCKGLFTLVNKELYSRYKRYISTKEEDLLDTITTYGNLANFFVELPKLKLFVIRNKNDNIISLNNTLTESYKINPLVFLETFEFLKISKVVDHELTTQRLVVNVDVLSSAHLNIFIKRMIDVFYSGVTPLIGTTLGRRLAKCCNADMFAYASSKHLSSLRTLRSKSLYLEYVMCSVHIGYTYKDCKKNKNSPNGPISKLLDALWLVLSNEERVELLNISSTTIKTENDDFLTVEGFDDNEILPNVLKLLGIHLYICDKLGISKDDAMLKYPNAKAFLDLNGEGYTLL